MQIRNKVKGLMQVFYKSIKGKEWKKAVILLLRALTDIRNRQWF